MVVLHGVLFRLPGLLDQVADHDVFLVEALHLVRLLVALAGELGFTHMARWVDFVAAGAAHAKVIFLEFLNRV